MATLGKEITLSADNRVGTLAQVTAPIKEAGVSIRALSAWGEGSKANFLIVTDNNEKAIGALRKAGLTPQEREVVLTELQNRIGTLAEAAQKLRESGVDIEHCYVSASGNQALAVFATKDNNKAVKALS